MEKAILTFCKNAFRNSNTLKTKMSMATFFMSFCFTFAFIYLLIGSFVPRYERDYNSNAVVVNAPDSFVVFSESILSSKLYFEEFDAPYDFITFGQMMNNHRANTLIYFPENFDDSGSESNEVLIYINTNSLLNQYNQDYWEETLNQRYTQFLVEQNNATNISLEPISIAEDVTMVERAPGIAYPVAMTLPLLLFIFSIYVAMSGGTNVIAGEKERGTFGGIIMSPVKRSSIVLGNFLGVFIMSLAPALLITILGLSVLKVTSPAVIIAAFLLTLSFVAFITSLAILVSVTNHTIVAAQTSFLPIFLVLLITAITCIEKLGNSEKYYNYFPIYGHFYGLGNAFTYSIVDGGLSSNTPVLDALICSIITIAITSAILFICTRLLYTEKYTTISDGITLKDIKRAKKAPRFKFSLSFIIDQIFFPLITLSVVQLLAMIPAAVIHMRNSSYSDFILNLKDVKSIPEIITVTGEILGFF